MAGHRRGSLDAAAHLLTSMADRSKLWVAVATARWASDRECGRQAAVRALMTLAIQSAAVELIVKRVVPRQRPDNQVRLRFRARRPKSAAFPSGHSASAATAALLLADGRPAWLPLLCLLALAVAWSRMQTGLHHLSDVVGGLSTGLVTAVLVRRLFPLRRRRSRRVASPLPVDSRH